MLISVNGFWSNDQEWPTKYQLHAHSKWHSTKNHYDHGTRYRWCYKHIQGSHFHSNIQILWLNELTSKSFQNFKNKEMIWRWPKWTEKNSIWFIRTSIWKLTTWNDKNWLRLEDSCICKWCSELQIQLEKFSSLVNSINTV